MLKGIILVFITCIFSISFAVAQGNLNSSGLPDPIRVGVRDAAHPIGHDIRPPGSAEGFCGVFGRLLGEKIQRKINYTDIENEYLDSDKFKRFDGLRLGAKNREKGVDIECGPNSESIKTTSVAEGIDFSRSFYSTGIKLLLKESLAKEIMQNPEKLTNYEIGYVKKTTTANQLNTIGKLRLKPPYLTRDAALDALGKGEIQIYASDGIIVRTLLKQGASERRNSEGTILRQFRAPYGENGYTIYPYEPRKYITGDRTTENYVMAISKNTAYSNSLKAVIDDTLSQRALDTEERKNLEDYENQSPFFKVIPWEPSLLDRFLVFLITVIFLIIGVRIINMLRRRKSYAPDQQDTSSQNQSPQSVIYISSNQHNQPDMSENYKSKYDQSQAKIGGIVDTAHSGSSQQFSQYNYIEQRQTLVEAAGEIQRLLKQLERSNPGATEPQQITYVNDETGAGLKRRVVNALKAGGESAIEEFLDNPYLNVGKAIVKGWMKQE